MATSIFSIRNTLFGILAVMVLMVLGFSALNSFTAFGTLQNGKKVEALTKIADLLLTSANNWAVERGVTNAALNRPGAVAGATRSIIDKRRATADQAFTTAIAALGADGFPATRLAAVEKNFADIGSYRQQVDSELAKSKAERDGLVARGWVPAMTKLVITSQDVRGMLFQGIDLDGEATQLVALKHFAWLMSEYAGRERAVMGGTIGGGKPVTPEKLSLLSGFRGRVEAAWKIIQGAAGNEGMSSDIKASVEAANTSYFGDFQKLRLQVYAAGTASAKYPVEVPAWIEQATIGINSLLAVNKAVAKAWTVYDAEEDANALSSNLIAAASNWAVERGATNSALKAATAVSAQIRTVIEQRRKAGDAAYAAASELLRTWPEFKGKSDTVAALSNAHGKLMKFRARVDGALRQDASNRDAAVVKNWVSTISGAIMKTADLRLRATIAAAQRNIKVGEFLRMKHAGWTMAEYAGRERAVMGGVIASGKPLTPKQRTTLSIFRGRVLTAWEDVFRTVKANPGLTEVAASIAGARKAYFGKFENLRKKVYAASSGTASYPLSGGDWIQRSTAAINTLLAIQTAISTAALEQTGRSVAAAFSDLIINIIVMLAAIMIALAATIVIVKRVVGSIAAITEEMTALAEGDLTIEISGAGRSDEIGHMAGAVEVFKANALERERLEAAAKEAEIRAEQEKKQAMEDLADKFEANVGDVLKSVTSATSQLDSTAGAMSQMAERSLNEATAVASASEQASANVQTVASASEELSSSISEISRQVLESSRITSEAVVEAEKTNHSVAGLNEAAQKIGDVVDMINDIASQTNLLALNATIEAARAGEAGKGFAVVASEVKNLANQTAKATEEIGGQIAAMQQETNSAVDALSGITDTIGKINEIATSVSSAVEEQSAATQEITRNVEEASRGTQEVNQNIASVSEASKETGTASTQVQSASKELAEQAGQLNDAVSDFLGEVRAG